MFHPCRLLVFLTLVFVSLLASSPAFATRDTPEDEKSLTIRNESAEELLSIRFTVGNQANYARLDLLPGGEDQLLNPGGTADLRMDMGLYLWDFNKVRLAGEFRMAVIEGDLQTDNDARRVAATGAQAVQINTDGGCHLDSNMIMTAMESLDLDGVDILFIENVGNLVCPVEFDCGEDAKVALLSVTEGDDKPEKYPLLFNLAKAMVLNKVDLLPYVDFDRERARDFATRLNKELAVFEVSCRDGSGLEGWYQWLRDMRAGKL